MSNRMTKQKLVEEISEKARVNKAQASRVLKELANIACREASNGFIVPGICKLSVIRRKARRCRIPSTGQLVLIGARDALKIVPLGAAKNRVAPRDASNITIIEDESKPAADKHPPEDKVPHETAAGQSPESSEAGVKKESDVVDDGGDAGSIVFMCPDCGAMISAPPSSAGADGECPFCDAKIKIPDKDSADDPADNTLPHSGSGGDYILFTCEECGQEIECASSMGGLTASCPTCGSQVSIPMSSTVSQSAGESGASGDGGQSSSMTMRIDLMDLE